MLTDGNNALTTSDTSLPSPSPMFMAFPCPSCTTTMKKVRGNNQGPGPGETASEGRARRARKCSSSPRNPRQFLLDNRLHQRKENTSSACSQRTPWVHTMEEYLATSTSCTRRQFSDNIHTLPHTVVPLLRSTRTLCAIFYPSDLSVPPDRTIPSPSKPNRHPLE